MKPHPLCAMHTIVKLYPEDEAKDCAVCKALYNEYKYCSSHDAIVAQIALNNRMKTVQ